MTALIAMMLLLCVWWIGGELYLVRLVEEQRAHEMDNLPVYGNSVIEEFEEYAAVLTMLRTLIAVNSASEVSTSDFATLGANAAAEIGGVRSIWIMPGGTVRSVYPLGGNENLLGLNVIEDDRPGVREDVAAAIQSRRITVSDRFDREADTNDWIAWLAVYRGDDVWGLVALELDSVHLLNALGRERPAREPLLALLDDAGRTLYGAPVVFQSDPVTYALDRLEAGWVLGAAPDGGWVAPVRDQLSLFQIGGLAIVALLVSLVYLTSRHQAAENARLLAAARDAAILAERHRLAAELHDSVTQLIYSDVLLAQASRQVLASGDNATADRYLGRIGETAQQALKEMRLLLFELRNPVVEQEGLADAIQRRLDAVERRAGVTADLQTDDGLDLPPDIENALFLVASEALNNSLKHASATSVTVELRRKGDLVEVKVSDNGRGFDPETAYRSGGMGFTTMRERAERIGGALTIDSAPGAGAVVLVKTRLGRDSLEL